jgi:hypothetical protein
MNSIYVYVELKLRYYFDVENSMKFKLWFSIVVFNDSELATDVL